jgi:hypothetical protein
VTGSSTTGVNWTASGGTISGTGATVNYTAPGTAGTYIVTAISAADLTKSAIATVTVTSAGSVDGLFIPSTHPRIFFNPSNLAQARAWYTAHPFTPNNTGDDRYYLALGAHYLMTGNASDCQTVINAALAQTYADTELENAGPDGPRWNGDVAIVAAFDWCNSQLTAAQSSTLRTNWNHYLSVLDQFHAVGGWGGPDMEFSNYNWGYVRNNITWGMAIYDQDPINGKTWLDNGLTTRWTDYFLPLSKRAGPQGGLGGMPEEGSEYGNYLAWYSIFPFVTANQMGLDLYNQSTFFPDLAYWLIYETPMAQSEGMGWQPFSWADDENWVNGNELTRGNYFGDYMITASNYWSGTNLSQYARQWVNMTGSTANPWVQSLDKGGSAASFAALPLDYYAPGYQQMYVQDGWTAANTREMWQMGAPQGVGHNHNDWGTFQIWKNGTWLSRESVGYAQSVAGFGGSGSQGVNTVYAHNGVLFGGNETGAGNNNIAVTRLESEPGYTFAAVDLGVGGSQSWNREFVFVRDLETTVILDRLNTGSAATSTTFLLHSETNPTIEDARHLTMTNGAEALRMTMLEPSAPSIKVVTEGAPGQYRIEATNGNPGNADSYLLTVLQAKDATAANISPAVVDSNPGSPTSGTFTVTLDANHTIVFNKGTTSLGGTISINGTQTNFRTDVEPITVNTTGITWGP